MRTAEEYYEQYISDFYRDKSVILKAINVARKEVIEESYKNFTVECHSCGEMGAYQPPSIERESVDALLNQVK